MVVNIVDRIIYQIAESVSPNIKHNDTVEQIEMIFRRNGYHTTREYPIFKMKDKPERAGRIDLVARKGKFRVTVEYDHHRLIKWKSFQKMVQLKPEIAIAITRDGYMKPNIERANKYKTNLPLYLISLREKKYELVGGPKEI
jgi:hypothetical protein